MARGKQAAKAANRRTSEAETQIARLEAELGEVRARHARELQALRTEVVKAQQDVLRRAAAMSASDLSAATARASAAEQSVVDAQMAVLHCIKDHGDFRLTKDGWPALASLIGVPVGSLFVDGEGNRHARRTNYKKIRLLENVRAGDWTGGALTDREWDERLSAEPHEA